MIKNYLHPYPFDVVANIEGLSRSDGDPTTDDVRAVGLEGAVNARISWCHQWYLAVVEVHATEIRFGRVDPHQFVTDFEAFLQHLDEGVIAPEGDERLLEMPSHRLRFAPDPEVLNEMYRLTMLDYVSAVIDLSIQGRHRDDEQEDLELAIVNTISDGFEAFLRDVQKYELSLERINASTDKMQFDLEWVTSHVMQNLI